MPASASAGLRGTAKALRAVPRSSMTTAAKAAVKIADEEGRRAGSPIKGHKRRGLTLTAHEDIRDAPHGATCRIQGVSVAGWVWRTTGTGSHRVRRRKQGPKSKLAVAHPGSSGTGAWHRVQAAAATAVPQIFRDDVAEVIRG